MLRSAVISFCGSNTLVCVIPRITNFHTAAIVTAAQKNVLLQLRKKTGFPISHCKKALDLHDKDLQKAEEWLQKEAQAHGWAKATKLSSRATQQGLIGIHIEGNVGSLVEVNCETDFVAKNADFQSLVTEITQEFAASFSPSITQPLEEPIKENVNRDTLQKIQTRYGNSLQDLLALAIGKIGENIRISRGVRFVCPPHLQLVGYTHPPSPKDSGLFGKYASVVAFQNASDGQIIREICAHITGLNPVKVGSLEDLDITEKSDEEDKQPVDAKVGEEADSSEEEERTKDLEKEVEKPLVSQKLLSDPEVTVGEVLRENNIQVIDFVRLECGEELERE